MDKDFKHQIYASNSSLSSRRGAFLIGLLLGAVITAPLTVYISGRMKSPPEEANGTGHIDKDLPDGNVEAKRFTFYDILTRQEQLRVQNSSPGVEVAPKSVIIQLGAFQNQSDADNFQAQMALLGFDPFIESVDLPDKGGIWFRVRLGPIGSAERKSVTQQLKSHGIKYAEIPG